MNTETLTESEKYTISHLGIIRFFVIWSILDLCIYFITNDNRKLELIIQIILFVIINIIIYFYPWIISFL
jgi:hypothetical protein